VGELKALIFNLIRGSFVDGHGIRTTVFLKGCPLRCLWCCNVEGQEYCDELKVTPDECDHCGNCGGVCPVGAIALSPLTVDRKICTNCGICAGSCTRGALQMFGRYYTVDELYDIIQRDERAYRTSGGGVTIAGGEPTSQPQFTLALIEKCQRGGIHTALDTCGYTVSDLSYKCLEEADLLLYDVKHMDSREHERLTGVPNGIILSNLRRLDAAGKEIIIRMPVIPGFNDSDTNITETSKFLSTLKSVIRLDLIGYHNYSGKKYLQLGKDYPLTMPAASEEYMEEKKRFFEQYGLAVQLGG